MAVQNVRATHGVAATGHMLATEAALDVLKRGGNAVDASVCAAFVLCVVCPYATSLAGDAYLLIHDPSDGRVHGLNGTGCAPAAADLARFAGGIPRSGALSATVPGLIAGLADALARFGTMPFAELLAPAIRHAEQGFAVHAYFTRNIEDRKSLLAGDLVMASVFMPDGAALAPGSIFRQPALAVTLRRLAEEGAESFYNGNLAQALADASAAQGGLLTPADLASHRSLWQEPVVAPFYGHDVWTMPPNSFGPTLLLQLLKLEETGIHRQDPDSSGFIAQGYAARGHAYKQAARLIGDPAFCEAPLRDLLAAAIAGTAATDARKMPAEAQDRCTTTVAVVDAKGMAVSLIESVSMPFGAGLMLGETGIILNNRLGGFNIDPASLNVIAPGKRPAHTLAPCMVTRNGKLSMAIGTPGTVGQTCVLAQMLARLLACGQEASAALAAPRWSADFQGRLIVEDTMAADLQAAVMADNPEARSEHAGWISFGSIKLAMRDGDGWRGLADDRRCASADGY